MKSQNQILMIALAIVFAVALAITVALICLSAMQEQEEDRKEPDSILYPIFSSRPQDPPPFYITEYDRTNESLPSSPDDTGNGLLFRTSGNGCCSLVGLGTCTDAFVVIPEYSPAGDRVTAVADRALMGCSGITAIQIPASVCEIGSLAFADCPNLIYISVSERNPFYRDREGVLYSADGNTLLLYPPMHSGTSVYLPATLTSIESMAFYRCVYLTAIRYAGSAEQWDRIAIGTGNYSLTAASVLFMAGESS